MCVFQTIYVAASKNITTKVILITKESVKTFREILKNYIFSCVLIVVLQSITNNTIDFIIV